MNIHKYKNQIRITFLLLLVILSIIPFYERVQDCLIHPELQNTTDMDIFAGAGKQFLKTGQLYQRSSDYEKTYAPGAGVYKFPPAYQLTILPLLKLDLSEFSFLLIERVIQLVMYLSASILLIITIGKEFIWQNQPALQKNHRNKAVQFVLISLLFTMWSMGFFESFSGIEPEILIFFLLALAFHFLSGKPFLAGAFIATATAFKIYPAFVLLYFIFRMDLRALSGFVFGLVLITACSVYYIGIDEHIFYIKTILPELLNEKPIYHIQNTTIEAMVHANNMISSMNGEITFITKSLAVMIILFVGLSIKNNKQESFIFYGMIICGILLCLSNYWQQYQVILAIPLFSLLAYGIQKKSIPLYVIIIVTSIALCIQEGWFQELKTYILDQEVGTIEKINTFFQNNPSLKNTNPFLYFFPCLWILLCMRDLVFLSPAVFLLLSAGILLGLRLKAHKIMQPN